MRIIEQSAKLLTDISEKEMLEKLEEYGRVCYKSEGKITEGSAEKFVSMIKKNNHQSVLEHVSLTFRLITDRGVSHELVRHRLASYSQESTRYVKYNDVLEFVFPKGMLESGDGALAKWRVACIYSEDLYKEMLKVTTPQQARTVLNNSFKTELVMTANLREWLHIIKMRTSPSAHPQMRELMEIIQSILSEKYPIVFG